MNKIIDFSIEKKLLLKPLQKVVSILSSRPRLPILNHILLEIISDRLIITSTDLELEIVATIFLKKSYTSGIFTISGKKFFDICRNFSELSIIFISVRNKKVIIKSGTSQFSLSTFTAENFPKFLIKEKNIKFFLSKMVLKTMIELVYFAMGNQDTRHYLNGMLLEMENNKIRVVATDGRRLATCNFSFNNNVFFPNQSIIIPRKGVLEILKLLNISENQKLVDIRLNNNNSFSVITDNYVFTTKLIDFIFPDYHHIFPKSKENILEVNRNLLKQSLKRALIVSNEQNHVVKFSITDNKLKIFSNNFQDDSLEEILHVSYEKKNLEIAFDINYLLDIINVINSQILRFFFTDEISSVQIEGHPIEYNSIYIIMPVRM